MSEAGEGWFDRLLIARMRQYQQRDLGYRADLPGYPGMLQEWQHALAHEPRARLAALCEDAIAFMVSPPVVQRP